MDEYCSSMPSAISEKWIKSGATENMKITPCIKRSRNPQSEKIFLWNPESWALEAVIMSSRNPKSSTWIRNPWHRIQNARQSRISLHGAIKSYEKESMYAAQENFWHFLLNILAKKIILAWPCSFKQVMCPIKIVAFII